jgi:hypothetical protein
LKSGVEFSHGVTRVNFQIWAIFLGGVGASRLRPGDRDSVFAGAPAYFILDADRWLLGYTSYLIVVGRPLLQLYFLLAALLRRCSQRRFREGATFWFHICMPCYPGSGWGRQLWPARYPGLGDCWGLVGVG